MIPCTIFMGCFCYFSEKARIWLRVKLPEMVLWSSPHGNIQSPRTGIVEGNISFGKHNLESGAYFLHRKKEKKKSLTFNLFFPPLIFLSASLLQPFFNVCFFTLKLITHAVQTFSWAQTSLMKLSEGLQPRDNLCFCPESRKTSLKV